MNWSRVWSDNRWRKSIGYGLVAIAILLSVGLVRSPALASGALHYTELEFAPAPEVKLPEYTRFQMDNGMVVYLVEDHELPLIGGTAMFTTGDRFEPVTQVGLASITGEVMRSGGTTHYSPEELNQRLEQRAAAVETGIDATTGTASFSALSEDLEEVFELFADVIRHPAFPEDKLELSKFQWRGSIARRNDDPDAIATREFQKLIYGAESPYARNVEYSTLDNISRSDLINFYETYFHPQNMLLGIVGDFDKAAMRSLIESQFGDWQSQPQQVTRPTLPAVNQTNQGGVFLVNQPQLTQSYVQFGHLGGQFNSPDYAALSVLNEVLNGFGGRLVNQVRSRQGLAYVVYAYWSARFDYPGLFIGGGQTRSEATVDFIKSVLTEIERMQTVPITEAELKRAQDSVLNAFIFNFQTPGQTISRLMRYEYYGYPADFIFQYQKAVEETTIDQVLQAAQTYLKPEDIVTLVVGNAEAINPPLTTLTPNTQVTQIDITIPQSRG